VSDGVKSSGAGTGLVLLHGVLTGGIDRVCSSSGDLRMSCHRMGSPDFHKFLA